MDIIQGKATSRNVWLMTQRIFAKIEQASGEVVLDGNDVLAGFLDWYRRLYLTPFWRPIRHCFMHRQSVAFKRTIHSLARQISRRSCLCATRSIQLGGAATCVPHNQKTSNGYNIWKRIQSDALYTSLTFIPPLA